MAPFEDLLAVQQLDTSMDQLRHRRSTLPQLDQRRETSARLDAARGTHAAIEAELRGVRAAQKEAEDHASLLGDKSAELDAAMYDGSVTAHKELEAMQAERASLDERRRSFEDVALEQMELAEPLEEQLAEAGAAVTAIESELERIEAELTVARAEVDAELDSLTSQRAAASESIDAALLSRYDALREGLGGIAVARLVGARCDGCHLEIPSAQLEGVRRAPDDEVVSCPECARILVR